MNQVVGFEGYAVTEEGRVFSLNYRKVKGKVKELKGRNIKGGYLSVSIWKERKGHCMLIHRIVAEAFIPNPEGKPEVNHKNGVKTDNRVENLEWVTPSENIRHSFYSGFRKTTEAQREAWRIINKNKTEEQKRCLHLRKLTNEQVVEIREIYEAGGISQRSLAKMFGASQRSICAILNRKLYAEV